MQRLTDWETNVWHLDEYIYLLIFHKPGKAIYLNRLEWVLRKKTQIKSGHF